MEKTTHYHILLNSAIELVEKSKISSSMSEKNYLYIQLQQVEYELQIVEAAFLNEDITSQ